MSELEKKYGNKTLICCFGGMALRIGGMVLFEFLNYLSGTYNDKYDLLFYIDKKQCCYHKGIDGITNNIEDTVVYLNNKINEGKYEKVIFMGVSAGGYASILFGSLCENITHVVTFIPVVKLKRPLEEKYRNLKDVINTKTKYILFGDTSVKNIDDTHHISQCKILEGYNNVRVIKLDRVDLKNLRDNGFIKKIIDQINLEN